MRILAAVALLVGVGVIAFLVGSQGAEPPASRAARDDPRVEDLLYRIAALEDQMRSLEMRLNEAPAAAPKAKDAPSLEPKPAGKERAPEEKKRASEALRSEWVQRVANAPAGPQQAAAVRDGHAQLKEHGVGDEARRFLQRVLDRVGPASEAGLQAAITLGHWFRHDKDYARAEELYRQVERLTPAGSARSAEAIFQLAWNRHFQADYAGARREFERALQAPEIDPGTAAAARYAVAGMKRDSDDEAGARADFERVVAMAREHPGHGGVQYYVRLAKQRLAEGE